MARTVKTILEDDDKKLSLDNEELEISIGDDAAAPSPEEATVELKKQVEEANERAKEATQRAADAEARAHAAAASTSTAVQAQITTQEHAIEGKITTAKTNLESIKQQLKQAKAAGDTDAEVELQDAFTNARYDLNNAEWEKNSFANWKKQEAARFSAAAVNPNKSPYTDKEQAWIKDHPEFDRNKKFARLAKLAAQEALDDGIKQDTPAYFSYLETALKDGGFLNDDGDPLSGAGKQTTASVAATPVRTGNGITPPVNKNSKYPYLPTGFRIPSDWVQAAEDQGFEDVREYANDRLKIEAEDKGR